MSPLALIRRLYPAIATRDESALYKRLYEDLGTRRDALEGQIQRATKRAGSGSDAQHALLASPKYQEMERRLNPLFIARDNMMSAKLAVPNDDITARLLLATDDAAKKHQASLLHRGTRYHAGDRFLPENGVYVEGLSSELPGGGTQMLKELEAQFPGAAMYLESVANPATKDFYRRKGFIPQPDGSTPAIPNNLWVKPGDVRVKAAGGLVKMKDGGLRPTRAEDNQELVDSLRRMGALAPADPTPETSAFESAKRQHEALRNTVLGEGNPESNSRHIDNIIQMWGPERYAEVMTQKLGQYAPYLSKNDSPLDYLRFLMANPKPSEFCRGGLATLKGAR